MTGLRLAVSWLTVLPMRATDVDRAAARRAITASPLVGALLGVLAAALAWVLLRLGLPATLAGLLTVAALGLATRGMHIDGLVDTVDGLGCYGPPERAREVMRSGGAGPFGVAALVVAIGAQAIAFGALAASGRLLALGVAVLAGRVAVVWACRRGIAAAEGSGFGPLVADSQSPAIVVLWSIVLVGASVLAAPGHRVLPAVVTAVVALVPTILVVRHCVRRFAGLSGDVLGAALEITVTMYACAALAAT